MSIEPPEIGNVSGPAARGEASIEPAQRPRAGVNHALPRNRRSPNFPWTSALGAAVLLGAATLGAGSVYFVLFHPQGSRSVTVPLLAAFFCLGLMRWRWQLQLFVFATPLLYWLPAAADGERLRLARMLFPFVLLVWSARLLSGSIPPLRMTRLHRSLVLYMGLVLLSAVLTLWRYDPLLRWETVTVLAQELLETNRAAFWAYFRPEFTVVRETVVYLAGPMFLLLLLTAADARLLARLRAALLASVGVAAAVALFQKLHDVNAPILQAVGRWAMERVYGPFGDANTLGAYLALLLPVLTMEAAIQWRPAVPRRRPVTVGVWGLRIGLAGFTVLALLALTWAASRAAWLGPAAGLVMVTHSFVGSRAPANTSRARTQRRRVRGIAWGMVAIAALLLIAHQRGGWSRPSTWQSPLDAFLSLFNPTALQFEVWVRMRAWEPALRMAAAFPVTGVGVGSYRYFCDAFGSGPVHLGILGEPHNYFLKPLSELGVPGLCLVVWIGWSLRRTWRQCLAKDPDVDDQLRRYAAGAGLLALCIDLLFQHVLAETEMQLITASVAAIAVYRPRNADDPSGLPLRRRWPLWTAAGLVASLVVWSGWYRTTPIQVAPAILTDKIGPFTEERSGVWLPVNGVLSTTFDFELGRALVVVRARAQDPGTRPHLILTVDGDHAEDWMLGSALMGMYRKGVFTAPGPRRIALQYVPDHFESEPAESGDLYIERVSVVQGHQASHFAESDAATLDEALGALPARVVTMSGEAQDALAEPIDLMRQMRARSRQPFGWLDSPEPGAVVKGWTPVRGWAMDSDGRVTRIQLLLDGAQLPARLRHNAPRAGVCTKHENLACPNVGFVGEVDFSNVRKGRHQLWLRLTDNAGQINRLPNRVLTVE